MKIGVRLASGQLGAATVAKLIQRGAGHEIVGISRSPDKVRAPVAGSRR